MGSFFSVSVPSLEVSDTLPLPEPRHLCRSRRRVAAASVQCAPGEKLSGDLTLFLSWHPSGRSVEETITKPCSMCSRASGTLMPSAPPAPCSATFMMKRRCQKAKGAAPAVSQEHLGTSPASGSMRSASPGPPTVSVMAQPTDLSSGADQGHGRAECTSHTHHTCTCTTHMST